MLNYQRVNWKLNKAEDAVEMPGNHGKPAVYVGFHWANHLYEKGLYLYQL